MKTINCLYVPFDEDIDGFVHVRIDFPDETKSIEEIVNEVKNQEVLSSIGTSRDVIRNINEEVQFKIVDVIKAPSFKVALAWYNKIVSQANK